MIVSCKFKIKDSLMKMSYMLPLLFAFTFCLCMLPSLDETYEFNLLLLSTGLCLKLLFFNMDNYTSDFFPSTDEPGESFNVSDSGTC